MEFKFKIFITKYNVPTSNDDVLEKLGIEPAKAELEEGEVRINLNTIEAYNESEDNKWTTLRLTSGLSWCVKEKVHIMDKILKGKIEA